MRDWSPKSRSPITASLNSIMLHVRVPVLSENMYSIWPSSSFSDDENTVAPLFLVPVFSKASLSINLACTDFTIYKDTTKEMGIIVLNSTK